MPAPLTVSISGLTGNEVPSVTVDAVGMPYEPLMSDDIDYYWKFMAVNLHGALFRDADDRTVDDRAQCWGRS